MEYNLGTTLLFFAKLVAGKMTYIVLKLFIATKSLNSKISEIFFV